MSKAKIFWKQFKGQAAERGWLLTAIAASCAAMGVTCLMVGVLVAYLALARDAVPVQQPAAMFAAGMLLLAATYSMWKYERWGRNLAVAVTVCLGWVMAEALQRRTGIGVAGKVPVMLFVALSLSYFTSAKGRALFRKKDKDEDGEANAVVG